MARTLDEVLAKVTEANTKGDGIKELIAGLRQQVKDALANAGKLSPEDQAKLDAIFDQAAGVSDDIDQALTANTNPTPDTVDNV